MKIYSIEPNLNIPETYDAFDAVWKKGLELGKWTEEFRPRLDILDIYDAKIKTALKVLTDEKEWNYKMYPHDISRYLDLPIAYHGSIDLLEAEDSDFPICSTGHHLMSVRMRDVILGSGVRGTSYPVAVFETSLLQIYSERQLIRDFDRDSNVRYYILHLFEILHFLDGENWDDYVATHKPQNLPPFFMEVERLKGSLLVTEEGKALLEQGKFRGVAFEELPVTWPEDEG
jgi:hypothetical protein